MCKVHVKSGVCSECNVRGHKGCDIKVSSSEWNRLRTERSKLLKEMREAREASAAAMEREVELVRQAREATSLAFAKEERLAQQLKLLDERADKAVAVTEANAAEAELEEMLSELPPGAPSSGSELMLSPYTWDDGSSGLDPSAFFSDSGGLVAFDPNIPVSSGPS